MSATDVTVTDEDFAAGAALLARLSPPEVPPPWVSFADVAPRLGRSVGVAFGSLIGQPGLDLRTRELVTVSILATLGGCEPQLAFHAGAALRVGATAPELVEALTQLSVYAGVPRALNAVAALRPVLAAAEVDPLAESPRAVALGLLQALVEGDLGAAAGRLHDQVDWRVPAGDLPLGCCWSPPDGLPALVEQLRDSCRDRAVEPAEPLTAGDRVHVPLRQRTCSDAVADAVLVLQVSEGKVTKAQLLR